MSNGTASNRATNRAPNGAAAEATRPAGIRLLRRSSLPHRRHVTAQSLLHGGAPTSVPRKVRTVRASARTERDPAAKPSAASRPSAAKPATAATTATTAPKNRAKSKLGRKEKPDSGPEKVSLVRRVSLERRVPKRRRVSLRKHAAQQPGRWKAFAPAPIYRPGPIRRVALAIGRAITHEYTLATLGSLILSVIMTWPTMRHPTRTVPQDLGDPVLQAWQLAWSGHALDTDPGSIFDSNTFFPEKLSFAFSDTLLGFAPLGLVGHGVSAAILRYNIVFTLAFALAFLGAYALARQFGAVRSGAVVAAAAFAYAPWRWGQAGHLHVLSSGGIVLALAMLARGHGFSLRRGYRPQDAKPGWALAGWLVAAWQVSLGFGIGLPFVYLLALLVVGTVVAWLFVPRRLITGAAEPPAPAPAAATIAVAQAEPGPPKAATGSPLAASAQPTLLTTPAHLRTVKATPAAVQRTEPQTDVIDLGAAQSRPEPTRPERPKRPAGPIGRWVGRRAPVPKLLLGADVFGGLIFAAVGILMAIPYLRVVDAHPYARRSVEELDIYSTPVHGFLTAPAQSWLWGHEHSGLRSNMAFPAETALLLGFVLIGLALAGLLYSIWPYYVRLLLLVAMAVSVVLAMGTKAPFGGEFTYLPLYDWLPGWDGIRTPGRLVLWTTLIAGILAAGVVSAFAERARDFTIERGSGPYPGPVLRLALLLPMVLVLVEGVSASEHPEVPRPPAALAQAEAPLLVLPSDQLSDELYMLWSTDGFPAIVNGGSGFVPERLDEVRQVTENFPDTASVNLLRDLGVRTVVVVKSLVVGTPYEAAANADTFGVDVEVEDTPEAVIYRL